MSVGLPSTAVLRTSSQTSHRGLPADLLPPVSPAAPGHVSSDFGSPCWTLQFPSLLPLLHLLFLQSSLSPSPAEVSACLWADAGLARAMVSAVDGDDGGLEKDEEGVAAEKLPTSVR